MKGIQRGDECDRLVQVGVDGIIVRHGGEISRGMHIPHREIEAAFGITGHARWVIDPEYATSAESAAHLRKYLPIDERWERHAAD